MGLKYTVYICKNSIFNDKLTDVSSEYHKYIKKRNNFIESFKNVSTYKEAEKLLKEFDFDKKVKNNFSICESKIKIKDEIFYFGMYPNIDNNMMSENIILNMLNYDKSIYFLNFDSIFQSFQILEFSSKELFKQDEDNDYVWIDGMSYDKKIPFNQIHKKIEDGIIWDKYYFLDLKKLK